MKIKIEKRIVEINNELANRFEQTMHEKINTEHVVSYIELCTKKDFSPMLLNKITNEELISMIEIGLHADMLEDYDLTSISRWIK